MFSFFKLLKDGSIWLKNRQDRLASSRSQLYQDLSLPLNLFIRCLVHSDLQALVISGNPKQEDIAEAWAGIYDQYLDLNHENEPIYILILQKEITLLTAHINETETALYFLAKVYHEGCCRVLRSNGWKDIVPEPDAERMAALVMIQNKLAPKKLKLDGKLREYNEYVDAHVKDEVTESYFTRTLIRLAKYQGVAIIRTKDITIREFVELLRDYIEYVQESKTDVDGDKR